MSNWCYYDRSGNRNGPVGNQQLRDLVSQGVVGPETPIETDIGKKGLAKQIVGLFPKSGATQNINPVKKNSFDQYQGGVAPMNYPEENTEQNGPNANPFSGGSSDYCTNCGASVMPKALACMKCGAAPVGHRKFCRSCGTALHPEQVICIRCGESILNTQRVFQTSSTQFRNENGNNSPTGARTFSNAQAKNQFSTYETQPFLPEQNSSPKRESFNRTTKNFCHKQAENNTGLKVQIGIGIGVVLMILIFIGAMIGHDCYKRNLKLEEGRVNRLIAEEKHRTNMQILQMNQQSLERQQTARQKLEILKRRVKMENELNRNRWNMSEWEIKIAQDRINRLKQQEN